MPPKSRHRPALAVSTTSRPQSLLGHTGRTGREGIRI